MPLRCAVRAICKVAAALLLLAVPVAAAAQDNPAQLFGETGEDSWRCDAEVTGNGTSITGQWLVSRNRSYFAGANWRSDVPLMIDDYRTQTPMMLSAYWPYEQAGFEHGRLLLRWQAGKRLPRQMQVYVDGWGYDGTFNAGMGRNEDAESASGRFNLGPLMRWAGDRERLVLGIYGQHGGETVYLGQGDLPAQVLHQMRADLAMLVARLEAMAADFTRQCTRLPYDPSVEEAIIITGEDRAPASSRN